MAALDEELKDLNLYIPILDPQNEEQIANSAIALTTQLSNGVLSDRTNNSPLTVLIRGLAFVCGELLFYINQLPYALVLAFLKSFGIERDIGKQAIARIQFTLTVPLSTSFLVPAGFEVTTQNQELKFYTVQNLVIPAGSISAEVDAIAQKKGKEYNVTPFTLNAYSQPLAFLSTVTNPESAQGGSDLEPLKDAIDRGMRLLRRRNLVSALDYEEEAIAFMGGGSKAKAIGKLDYSTGVPITRIGSVTLFCLSSDGEGVNDTTAQAIARHFAPKIQIGTDLIVEPMEVFGAIVRLKVKLLPQQDPTDVADLLWKKCRAYFDRLKCGESAVLEELKYECRLGSPLDRIISCSFSTASGEAAKDLVTANAWTINQLATLQLLIVTAEGSPLEYLRGAGEEEGGLPI